jgi:LSD1 subclass zinc finger protein
MLCIVNPEATVLDESEGFLADLLSTHPPLRKRIDIMLGMARVPISDLEARRIGEPAAPSEAASYFAMDPAREWQGPFGIGELSNLPWLGPLTWISQRQGGPAERAWTVPSVNALFLARISRPERAEEISPDRLCPSCRQPLQTAEYEGTNVFRCAFCAGTLVMTDHIPRIVARTAQANPCTERINALARAVLKQNMTNQLFRIHSSSAAASSPKLACPKCQSPMSRGFYSLTYLVEIDRCGNCGLAWFDRDELEMLQCMIENRLVPDADSVPAKVTPTPEAVS